MEIKTKFDIGQIVYVAVFGERIDELQIEEINIAENDIITYKTLGGMSVREDQIYDTREIAVDALIYQEDCRHKRMMEYYQKQKEERQ